MQCRESHDTASGYGVSLDDYSGSAEKDAWLVSISTPSPYTKLDIVDGHYLNLPIIEHDGNLVGCVDVLKLTYATLEQVEASPSVDLSISISHNHLMF